jgi:two-component SAPR family response regulator
MCSKIEFVIVSIFVYMKTTIISALSIIVFFVGLNVNAQGISFNSSDQAIAKRTSFNVFNYKQPTFRNDFKIAFNLLIQNPDTFGYILNVKDINNSISYSLVYVGNDENYGEIKLNLEGVSTLITIPLLKEDIITKSWINVSLYFDPLTKKIVLEVDNFKDSINENLFETVIEPEIYFGKHRSIIDVPAMAIRDLNIENNKSVYFFGLKESEGEKVYDSKGYVYGNVKNGNWLIKESFFWKLRKSFDFNQVTSISFDKNQHRFIFQNTDSLQFYNYKNETTSEFSFTNKLDISMRLGNSLFDSSDNKLYIYELYDIAPSTSSIVEIDLQNPNKWKSISTLERSKQTHHHNAIFNEKDKKIIFFGGYGYFRFTNEFNSYDIEANKWEVLNFSGDTIDPRFFSGMVKWSDDKALLFGGQGNKTGDQSVGKTYYYDCYSIDFKEKKINKLWDIKRDGSNMVSSRNLVLNSDASAFYNLSYSEYISSTSLQLYKYTIKEGIYSKLGDSIPMNSESIRTNANLYFDYSTNELYTTTQEFNDDGSSSVKIYSLSSPPVSINEIQLINYRVNSNKYNTTLTYAILLLVLLIVAIYLFRRKAKIKIERQIEKTIKYENQREIIDTRSNAIYLFGVFSSKDSKGKDITHLFSPKIRQLFLLLIFNSVQKKSNGISSDQIHSILWPDSTDQNAKNLKNVALNQLRNILKDFEGLNIIYSDRKFLLEFSDEFYCDYFAFISELESYKNNLIDQSSLRKLVNILNRGKFLEFINDDHFDSFKRDFEFDVLGIIPNEMKRFYDNKEYSDVIPITEILLNIDSLNLDAFMYKIHALMKMKMNSKAKKYFNYFVVNYSKITGEEFNQTFRDILKRDL